jgi:hypothetical protein
LLAAGAVAACAQLPPSQQPGQASNPSVTYSYRPAPAPVNPNPSYTYRTDQKLVQVA